MDQVILKVVQTEPIAASVFKTILRGDLSAIIAPGQFVNIKIEGLYLRRPISVSDVAGDELTIVYKAVGKGTDTLSNAAPGQSFDALTGLGNGYDHSLAGEEPLLVGGGVGVPPLYYLAKKLIEGGVTPTVALGFNKREEAFFMNEFEALGASVRVATVDGSLGEKGFVTEILPERSSYFYACGPEPMLKALFRAAKTDGEFSLEERMGCGFGACMGCSIRTARGNKRVCKDGPVFKKGELLW